MQQTLTGKQSVPEEARLKRVSVLHKVLGGFRRGKSSHTEGQIAPYLADLKRFSSPRGR